MEPLVVRLPGAEQSESEMILAGATETLAAIDGRTKGSMIEHKGIVSVGNPRAVQRAGREC